MTLLVLLLTALSPGAKSFSPEEQALLINVEQGRFLAARSAAESILRTNPRSFPGAWAMTRISHDLEGNHPRALYYMNLAERLPEATKGDWPLQLGLEKYSILLEMSRNAEALEALERIPRDRQRDLAGMRIWPLMKLGRFDEATTLARGLIGSQRPQERADGYNGLLSIAFEQRNRQESYDWAMAGITATQGRSCTLLRNAGSSALTVFRLDEAESLMLRAENERDCAEPAGRQLADFYLLTGDFQRAISSLKTMQRQPIEQRYRAQFALSRRAFLSDLLLALGRFDEAASLAEELGRLQSRTGMSSNDPELEKFSRALRAALALDAAVTLTKERASYAPTLWQRLKILATLPALYLRRWEWRRASFTYLAQGQRLNRVVRPYLGEPSDWPGWQLASLGALTGRRALEAAIREGRTEDARYPEALGYFDAAEGELSLSSAGSAEAYAQQALARLPMREGLLRWRTTAYQADALWRLGRRDEARNAYQEVLRRWPTVLRLLDLSLPVQLRESAGTKAAEAAQALRRSRRFALDASSPFVVAVDEDASGVTVCLRDEHGEQLACGHGTDAPEAVKSFHDTAFSPRISMAHLDTQSLDGSPTRIGVDEALKQVLGP